MLRRTDMLFIMGVLEIALGGLEFGAFDGAAYLIGGFAVVLIAALRARP